MVQKDALIVRLQISQWTARKYDLAVTKEVAKNHGATANVGRYNKRLVSKDALAKVTQAVNEARSFHYVNTLPWDDGGGRLLPVKNFMKYREQMSELHNKFDEAVSDFVDAYEELREESKKRLGNMFSLSDYPSKSTIQYKFGFQFDIEPVPYSGDFRVDLDKQSMERIKTDVDKEVTNRVQAANNDLYQRLLTVVGRFVETLSQPDKRFTDTLVTNAADLVDLIPRLNITQDPKIEKFREEISRKLVSQSPEKLRTDQKQRASVAVMAKTLFDRINKSL